jgi:hypothetical protein
MMMIANVRGSLSCMWIWKTSKGENGYNHNSGWCMRMFIQKLDMYKM